MIDAKSLHAQCLIVDAVAPLADNPSYLDWYETGGVTALGVTVSTASDARTALARLARWHGFMHEQPGVRLLKFAADLDAAKRDQALGLYFHFQGSDAIETNLDLVDLYKALGVGMVQLTYNVKSRVGDGCEETVDGGLSKFGARLIERLNRARVIVDCSHTGPRTSLDAISVSAAPVVLSHSNAKARHQSARNASDDLIRAVAQTGGVIGAVGFPAMVSSDAAPNLDQFIDHIAYIADCVGVEHVGLGIDYYSGQAGIASDEAARAFYETAKASGIWSEAYPPPPHHYPAGIDTPKTLPLLTERLLARGFHAEEVTKIVGANWRRVMAAVWGERR